MRSPLINTPSPTNSGTLTLADLCSRDGGSDRLSTNATIEYLFTQ
ncbi:hypothetical protein [Oscillatoria acuminata]|nr:hypothetical protein [Oscillatoria acuminata]